MNTLGHCKQPRCHGVLCVGWVKELKTNTVKCSVCDVPQLDNPLAVEIAAAAKAPVAPPPAIECQPLQYASTWPERLAALEKLQASQAQLLAGQAHRIEQLEAALAQVQLPASLEAEAARTPRRR